MDKNQEKMRMRLLDAVFGRYIVDMCSLFAAIMPEQKVGFDGEFLMAMTEKPNGILKCAMYLFVGYLDEAINSPSHMVVEAATTYSHGNAKKVKMTASHLLLHDASSSNDEILTTQMHHEWNTNKHYCNYLIYVNYLQIYINYIIFAPSSDDDAQMDI